MATLLRPKRWLVKPAGSVVIDWGHPLARGLAGLWLPNGIAPPIDLVTGIRSTAGSTPPGQGFLPSGVGASSTQANTSLYSLRPTTGPIIAGQANWSVFGRFRASSSAVNGLPLYNERAASGNDILKLNTPFSTGTDGGVGATIRDDAGNLLVNTGSGIAVMDGKEHSGLVAFSFAGTTGTYAVYQDGRSVLSGSGTFGNAYTNALAPQLFADAGDINSNGAAVTPIVAIWTRTLTADQAEWLHVEPYAMLARRSPVKHFLLAGPPLSSTVAASATLARTRTLSATAGTFIPPVAAHATLARTRGLTASATRLTNVADTLARTRGLTATAGGLATATLWTIETSQSFARTRDLHAVTDLTVPVTAAPYPETYIWQVSPVMPAPTIDATTGRPNQPWIPTSVTVSYWGRLRVRADHGDRTYPRGIPADVRSWSNQSPFGDGPAELAWPGITPFDTVGGTSSTFPWLREGAKLELEVVKPNGSVVRLWSGLSASVETEQDESSYAKGMHGLGALFQADLAKHQPSFAYNDVQDIGDAIARELNTVPSRRYGHLVAVTTGITTTQRGSRDQDRLTGYVADRLGEGTEDDGLHQYSIEQVAPRRYAIQHKRSPQAGDAPDFYFTVGTPGLTVALSKDITAAPRRIFAQAVTPAGCVTQNIKTPNFHPDDSTPYPNSNPAIVLTIGTTDASTTSGTGVTDLQRRLHDTFDTDQAITGIYDAATADTVRDFQASAGITVDGIVGGQTWTTLFQIGSNVGDLSGMYYAPFAEDSAVDPYLRGATGAIIGANPNYDSTQVVVDRFEDLGEGLTKKQVKRSAKAELARDHTPGVYGTITARIDPEDRSRFDTRSGQILGLRAFEGAAVTGLYVANAEYKPADLSVVYTVDSKARDLMTVAAMISRDKQARLDRANHHNVHGQSKRSLDITVQYDCEAAFGLFPRTPLFGGLAVVTRIPFGQSGQCVEVDLTTTGPAAPFAVAVFGKPINVADVNAALGTSNPTAATASGFSVWTEKQDALNALGLITAWGEDGQRCGYDPLAETTPNATTPVVTGKFTDQGGFTYSSQKPPWLWLYIYSPTSCFISGQFKNAPLT